MDREQFNLMTNEERYKFLHDLQPEDYMGDRFVWLPTPGQIAHCDFENMPLPYQYAIEAYGE